MKIISHRGFWKSPSEKNSKKAFERSFLKGYGVETDLRDLCGKIVISHDMPIGNEILFDEFLKISNAKENILALNIKSDGLASLILETLKRNNITKYFVFDMSVPDMRSYLNLGLPVYGRLSEYEQTISWEDKCTGVWLDSFEKEWFDTEYLNGVLYKYKNVCIVSSELHGRDKEKLWMKIKNLNLRGNVMLCTDFPEEAEKFFNSI